MPDLLVGTIASAVLSAGTSVIGASIESSSIADATDKELIANRESIAAQKESLEKQLKAAEVAQDKELAAAKQSELRQLDAAEKALDKQLASIKDTQERDIEFQTNIFNQQKEALQPWQEVGRQALETIQTKIKDGSFDLSKYGYDELIQDPGYQFRKEQGTNALEAAAAARGKFISGDQLKDVVGFNQDLASQEFGAAFGRTQAERDTEYNILSNEAGRGQAAAAALSGVAGDYGRGVSSAIQTAGANNVNAFSRYGDTAVRAAADTGDASRSAFARYGANTANAFARYGDAASRAAENRGTILSRSARDRGSIWGGMARDVGGVGNRAIENILLYRGLGYA